MPLIWEQIQTIVLSYQEFFCFLAYAIKTTAWSDTFLVDLQITGQAAGLKR